MATHQLLNVLLGAFVLSAVIHPAGSVDRTALRWHVGIRSGFARYGGQITDGHHVRVRRHRGFRRDDAAAGDAYVGAAGIVG
jgi:hypothetical protein